MSITLTALLGEFVAFNMAVSVPFAFSISFLAGSYDDYKRGEFLTLRSSIKYHWFVVSRINAMDFRLNEQDFDRKYAPIIQEYFKEEL
ncbi:MAG: hypothetical protein Q7J54_04710 [Candidatus Woesearchaeota archaeon]|nr:hypothetical protein [Candidatus Woesearchaeota archaeon]